MVCLIIHIHKNIYENSYKNIISKRTIPVFSKTQFPRKKPRIYKSPFPHTKNNIVPRCMILFLSTYCFYMYHFKRTNFASKT